MQEQIIEYHLTAYHEAGHAIAGECIGYHFLDILFGYDSDLGRFDGLTCTQAKELGFYPELVRTVAGFVAQIMRESDGQGDLRHIQARILANEFHDSNDSDQWHQLIDENGLTDHYAQMLGSAIKDALECLVRNWDVLVAVAEACIATYEPVKRKGWLSRQSLPNEIQAQLDVCFGDIVSMVDWFHV